MMARADYPILEHDSDRQAMIRPKDFLTPTLPEKCVLTFFHDALEKLAAERHWPVAASLHSEIVDLPVYLCHGVEGDVCLTTPFATSPGAAMTLEELRAMGCREFLVCGGAGVLAPGTHLGSLILPTAALRDEGASYHYLPPAREVACHAGMLARVRQGLKAMGLPFAEGKTWTTDAMYRETPERVSRRRAEGCLTVEMEAAGFFAVSAYYGLPLAQLLYAGDDLSGEAWNARGWNRQHTVRENLIMTALSLLGGGEEKRSEP